jgi:hypothetical protein
MKTKFAIMVAVLAVLLTGFIACEKVEEVNPQVLDKKGGSGNGQGSGNNPNTPNPCANYPVYPVVTLPTYDFNITIDTSACGTMVFRWNPQPGFNPVTDTCYTIARYYYIAFANVGHTNGCGPNGGSISSTNAYYYTLGSGCSVWPGYTYTVAVSYYERNTTDQKVYLRGSFPVTFTAPRRAPFLNNCN